MGIQNSVLHLPGVAIGDRVLPLQGSEISVGTWLGKLANEWPAVAEITKVPAKGEPMMAWREWVPASSGSRFDFGATVSMKDHGGSVSMKLQPTQVARYDGVPWMMQPGMDVTLPYTRVQGGYDARQASWLLDQWAKFRFEPAAPGSTHELAGPGEVLKGVLHIDMGARSAMGSFGLRKSAVVVGAPVAGS